MKERQHLEILTAILMLILLIGMSGCKSSAPTKTSIDLTSNLNNNQLISKKTMIAGTAKNANYVATSDGEIFYRSVRVQRGKWKISVSNVSGEKSVYLVAMKKKADVGSDFSTKKYPAYIKLNFSKDLRDQGSSEFAIFSSKSSSRAASESSASAAISASASEKKSSSVSSNPNLNNDAVSWFRRSVQQKIQNQSNELSKADIDNKTNGVTYTATPNVTGYDQLELQKLASDLFSSTQGIAKMCDIPTPIPVTLNSANGNILARYKLNGDIKVYPQP